MSVKLTLDREAECVVLTIEKEPYRDLIRDLVKVAKTKVDSPVLDQQIKQVVLKHLASKS